MTTKRLPPLKTYIPTSLKKVNITSASSISSNAFYECGNLTSITIPETVASIGSSAFYECGNLTSITVPESVASIGSSAFYGCSSLFEITLPFVGNTKDGTINTHFGYIFGASSYSDNSSNVPTSLKKVNITSAISIGLNAFYNCNEITEISIPTSVTSIGASAFYNCSSLTKVIVSKGLDSIGPSAFDGCRSLTFVFYGGTAEEWNKITIGDYNSYLTRVTRYYYSKTQPTTAGNYWHYDENGEIVEW